MWGRICGVIFLSERCYPLGNRVRFCSLFIYFVFPLLRVKAYLFLLGGEGRVVHGATVGYDPKSNTCQHGRLQARAVAVCVFAPRFFRLRCVFPLIFVASLSSRDLFDFVVSSPPEATIPLYYYRSRNNRFLYGLTRRYHGGDIADESCTCAEIVV